MCIFCVWLGFQRFVNKGSLTNYINQTVSDFFSTTLRNLRNFVCLRYITFFSKMLSLDTQASFIKDKYVIKVKNYDLETDRLKID